MFLVVKFKDETLPTVVQSELGRFEMAQKMFATNANVEWVHEMDDMGYSGYSMPMRPDVPDPVAPVFPDAEKFTTCRDYILDGRKIQAIKEYRNNMKCGLREAKDAIEAASDRLKCRDNSTSYPVSDPFHGSDDRPPF